MTVFISYTHDDEEHKTAVRRFAECLRAHGIDADIDSWATTERRDWQPWMTRLVLEAEFVIVVASPVYREMGDGLGPADRNHGVQAEAALLRDLLQSDRPTWTRKILPVLLPGHGVDEIPYFLQPYAVNRYEVTSFTAEGMESLLRVITAQPEHVRPPLGPRTVLPPKSGPGAAPSAPRWRPLREPVPVHWLADLMRDRHRPQSAVVELHLVPAAGQGLLGIRQLQRLAGELPGAGRSRQLFSHAQGLHAGSSGQLAWAFSRESRHGEAGLAVRRDGQRSCWFGLPPASIGAVLDEKHLTGQIAARLRLLLELGVDLPEELAPAVGLDNAGMVHLGRVDEPPRTAVTLHWHDRVRAEPEEALTAADLRSFTQDIADELAGRLAEPLRT
ncbi:hypothetical protein GCM10027445_43720 [Amycolatopsis endophytica]|uniref:SEFIR domain-containing protein n=1 Tax=Amycolatopsis endophytica TaxID=860233 RepID=A0A853BFI6_9PSEU|nr:toll/interleukin-1 receptor domain-containing protein [Amycolatopsis endophytica]NYI93266.1 hypothetical protein [Amycolatopsis endophytica]